MTTRTQALTAAAHPVRRQLAIRTAVAALSALLVAGAGLVTTPAAIAQEIASGPTLYRGENGDFDLPIGKSGVIRIGQSARRVAVANPAIADVLVLRGNEVYIVGKSVGSTNVSMWDGSERLFANININVTPDLEGLKRTLFELFPNDRIGVQAARQSLVLTGEVASLPRLEAAQQLASGFLPCLTNSGGQSSGAQKGGAAGGAGQGGQAMAGCSVVNLMQVGGAQQVMLEVKVAEVARTVLNRLDGGLNFLRFSKNGTFGGTTDGGTLLGPVTTPSAPTAAAITPFAFGGPGLFANLLLGDGNILQAVLEISRRNDLAKILAEPTLTTLSGQEAEFLSGGEFPIPVPGGGGGGGNGQVTIEFKDFGVGVKFVPVILDSGHINLKLAVNVSDIIDNNSVIVSVGGTTTALAVPSLSKRSASSTVELGDGQTIAIAGLISDNVREFVSKFPVLGDIPVLGALFRSQEFRHDETELVIFVTPHLAKPIKPSQVRLPTDSVVMPNASEFYLLGRMESPRDAGTPVDRLGRARGGVNVTSSTSFGHAQ
jgi:pilus assembly protein CpaC